MIRPLCFKAGRMGSHLRRSALAGHQALPSRQVLPSRRVLAFILSSLCVLISAQTAWAQAALLVDQTLPVQMSNLFGMSIFIALVLITSVTALLYVRGRQNWLHRQSLLTHDLTLARSELDRCRLLLSAEQQMIIVWGHREEEPEMQGELAQIMDKTTRANVLAFGTWLDPHSAAELDAGLEQLRSTGQGFKLSLQTLTGLYLEGEGLALNGRAVLRLRDVSGAHLELIILRDRYESTLVELQSLRNLLNAIPQPVWTRNQDGQLNWVNQAYARAVDLAGMDEVITNSIELLDQDKRQLAERERQAKGLWRDRVPAIVAGQRHMLDILELNAPIGAAGFANDLSELEAIRNDLGLQMEAHKRTLDQLGTSVAIFDRMKRLVFHNAAYRQLWALDANFLDQAPSDSEILDRLRTERKLPEQADFRIWKADLMAAYQSVEMTEQVWHLPDGRTLRTFTNPNPQGGLTYLFDDVTERFHLESQYNALIKVQGETLDTLKEGVAVFGTDGRLKLFNTAFADMWSLDLKILNLGPHVDDIAHQCQTVCVSEQIWQTLRSAIAGLHDARTGLEVRMMRKDDHVIDCASAPLPDGSTLLTFTDVTAGVNVERALTERNKALLDVQNLRDDFVHHVSYELRSPLTNIIGFIQLLAEGAVGSLNPKQQEYTGYVLKSSAALLAIINDILDLATIDKDSMELDLEDIDVDQTIKAAADGLQDRLAEMEIQLNIVLTDGVGKFRADAKRIRQILFNLLSNAIGFSAPGQTVSLAALRRGDEVIIKVSDQGRGIPPSILDRVFDRFQSNTMGSRHRGVGLGLSIVKAFVELHGGRVLIESAPGEGTVVTCIFPAKGQSVKSLNVA
jgi:signal transduction histidine kinase